MSTCDDCGAGQVGDDGICGACGMERVAGPSGGPASVPVSIPVATTPMPSSPTPTGSTGSTSGSFATTAVTGPPSGQLFGAPRAGMPANPEDLVLDAPSLPEAKRICRNPQCRRRVGRARNRVPGRVVGFCQECGWAFDFRPPLGADTVVGSRYEIRGAIGRGGIGWIYLARDRRLPRWVVLKGVSEPELPGTEEVVESEVEALIEADHPAIVAVHDKVAHDHRLPGPDDRVLRIEYIVMELVSGRTLRQILRERLDEGRGRLPADEVCEVMAEALTGLGHLHDLGLAYNDFSDDNVMYSADGRVRTIDLGGVTRIGRTTHSPQRKQGYADPTDPPPSVQSDLYPVGRTALRLTVQVPEFRDAEKGIPGPGTVPLFVEHESFHLLLCRTSHADPEQRFGSAAENADAFRAVAREIRSRDHGPQPGRSIYFGRGIRAVGDDPDAFPTMTASGAQIALALPELQVDLGDRHAGRLTALLHEEPEVVRAVLGVLPDPSPESRLLAIRAGLGLRADATGPAPETLRSELDELATARPDHGWPASFAGRVAWTRGLVDLATGSPADATKAFRVALEVMPGEAAPKLAVAHCAELLAAAEPDAAAEHRATALRYFGVVARTDPSWVGAGFGLARCHAANGDRAAAEQALRTVPEDSRLATNAALCALRIAGPEHHLDPDSVLRFFARAERLRDDHADPLDVDERRRGLSTIAVLQACATRLDDGGFSDVPDAPRSVLGWSLDPRGMRRGLEHTLRILAALPGARRDRYAYVDRANTVRHWSLW